VKQFPRLALNARLWPSPSTSWNCQFLSGTRIAFHAQKPLGQIIADSAHKGIWRPDSLPNDAAARIEFFEKFAAVSLKTLGLQLSEDTVAKVNGRIARSFEDASRDMSSNIYRLSKELRDIEKAAKAAPAAEVAAAPKAAE